MSTERTLAVLGAGPGVGRSVAARFGREGYRVGLVARNGSRLRDLVADLDADDVVADAFPADLGDRDALASALDAITERFGRIDVLEYGPLPGTRDLVSPLDIDVGTAQAALDTFLLGAVQATAMVRPGMIERGDGALLFTQGASARAPSSGFASVGMAMQALRGWIYSLHRELAPMGVFVGTITIGAMVTRGAKPGDPMMVDPDDIASIYWEMLGSRDRIETVVGAPEILASPPGWS